MRQLARHLYQDSATDLRIALAESSSFGQGRHAVGQALARHQLRLAALVEQLARSTTDAGQDFVYREAVCGSCSTEAQLAVLGLVQPRAPAEHVGAVLSHLAFSQQVLHHHLRGSAGPEGYARKEREILHGLRVGGAFVYAPSLSFIEEVLPASIWRVVRHAIPSAR